MTYVRARLCGFLSSRQATRKKMPAFFQVLSPLFINLSSHAHTQKKLAHIYRVARIVR